MPNMGLQSLGILLLIIAASHGSDLAVSFTDSILYAYNGTEVTFQCLFNTTVTQTAIKVEWYKRQGDLSTLIWTSSITEDEADSEWFDHFFYSKPSVPPSNYSHSHALVLKSAELRDGGSYICLVTDGTHEGRAPLQLTVCLDNEDICNGPDIKPPSPPISEGEFWVNVMLGSVFGFVLLTVTLHCYIDRQNDKKRKQWKSVTEDEPKQ